MPERDRDLKTMVLGIILGASTVSAVVWLIIRSMRQTLQGLSGNLQLAAGQQPINIYTSQVPQATQQAPLVDRMQLADGTSLATRTGTLVLSTIDTGRVFQAPTKGSMWKVRIYAVGPPGGFAVLAIDSAPSNNGMDSIIVPSGGYAELRIGPRQVIFGRALNSNTTISYTASAEMM